ncbi:MAG: serine/threonine-protein kinase [Kofleriaceae bacterium]
MILEPGRTLGRYTLVAPLGRGGMGGVWEVADDTGARFALKAPATTVGVDPALAKRFAREANALQMLEHPNLVTAADVFVEDDCMFIVMERVVGTTLGAAITAGPFQPRRALVVIRQILEGIGHAHARGFVHRDLKSDNIMLVDMGGWERAKIVDFGIVKLLGEAEAMLGGGKLTRTGTVAGTPAYMAPEQALGRIVDGRADLYAIGVIAFEMLTGRLPFEHPEPAMIMRMHVKAPPPPLDPRSPWSTPALVHLIETALAKDPTARFADAPAMIAALDLAFQSLDHVG